MENLHPVLTHFAPAAYVGAVLLELAKVKFKSSAKIDGALDILIAVVPLTVLMAFFSGYMGADAANQYQYLRVTASVGSEDTIWRLEVATTQPMERTG